MQQVREILNKIAWAIGYITIFIFLAGFSILFSAIYSSLDIRLHENAILRTLGANKKQLVSSLFTEFATLGFFVWANCCNQCQFMRLGIMHVAY